MTETPRRLNGRVWATIIICSAWPLVLPVAFWNQQRRMIRNVAGDIIPADPVARQGWNAAQNIRRLDLRLFIVQSVVALSVALVVCLALSLRLRRTGSGSPATNVLFDLSLALALFATPWLVAFVAWGVPLSSALDLWVHDLIPTHIPTICVMAAAGSFLAFSRWGGGALPGATA